LRVYRIGPYASEAVAIGKRVDPAAVGRPVVMSLQRRPVGDRNPGVLGGTMISAERRHVGARPTRGLGLEHDPPAVGRPAKIIEVLIRPLEKHARRLRFEIDDCGRYPWLHWAEHQRPPTV